MPMMPQGWHPLAICPQCQIVFEYKRLRFGKYSVVDLRGSTCVCPNGHRAPLLNGTFRQVKGALQVVSGSTFTRDQVARMEALKQQVARNAATKPNTPVPQEFLDALSEIAPGIVQASNLLKDGRIGWAMLLILLHLVLRQCDGNAPLIDLSQHTEIHYHEAPAEPHSDSQADPDAPNDGSGIA